MCHARAARAARFSPANSRAHCNRTRFFDLPFRACCTCTWVDRNRVSSCLLLGSGVLAAQQLSLENVNLYARSSRSRACTRKGCKYLTIMNGTVQIARSSMHAYVYIFERVPISGCGSCGFPAPPPNHRRRLTMRESWLA